MQTGFLWVVFREMSHGKTYLDLALQGHLTHKSGERLVHKTFFKNQNIPQKPK